MVSVIVPSFNAERHLRETLDAILAQQAEGLVLEVIVVDDGSSDASVAIAAAYGERLRLVRQANAGVSRARNLGLSLARGEFVCFVDHDDVWLPGKLAAQLAEFERDPGLGVVYSRFAVWHPDPAGRYPPPASLAEERPGLDEAESGWIYPVLLLDSVVLTSCAMARRERLAACGGFDESLPYSEDWDLWLRLSRQCRFAKLARVTTLYRQQPTQGSRHFRAIDYRTRLLEGAVRRWGLVSPDGGRLDRRRFRHQLARYHMDFGYVCLKAGERALGRRAFVKAWRHRPAWARPWICWLASCLGWTPKW
ncbi:glycosyltransferase family 2 protein [Pelomonas sp. CA6]|uniref:glycosyltransferase family 2 protein n=1 Tax=Pelomonas sp. CA6 TaxID=2907999 RepID=UPI001F4AE72B|nr:glycosyltransferase family A protein [Pelomonas sp. CA6]MCH7342792.1 glycosyltransferase family 2 protein [Pelomonas sp. CA6]